MDQPVVLRAETGAGLIQHVKNAMQLIDPTVQPGPYGDLHRVLCVLELAARGDDVTLEEQP